MYAAEIVPPSARLLKVPQMELLAAGVAVLLTSVICVPNVGAKPSDRLNDAAGQVKPLDATATSPAADEPWRICTPPVPGISWTVPPLEAIWPEAETEIPPLPASKVRLAPVVARLALTRIAVLAWAFRAKPLWTLTAFWKVMLLLASRVMLAATEAKAMGSMVTLELSEKVRHCGGQRCGAAGGDEDVVSQQPPVFQNLKNRPMVPENSGLQRPMGPAHRREPTTKPAPTRNRDFRDAARRAEVMTTSSKVHTLHFADTDLGSVDRVGESGAA